jgi:hypothetical protein
MLRKDARPGYSDTGLLSRPDKGHGGSRLGGLPPWGPKRIAEPGAARCPREGAWPHIRVNKNLLVQYL